MLELQQSGSLTCTSAQRGINVEQQSAELALSIVVFVLELRRFRTRDCLAFVIIIFAFSFSFKRAFFIAVLQLRQPLSSILIITFWLRLVYLIASRIRTAFITGSFDADAS